MGHFLKRWIAFVLLVALQATSSGWAFGAAAVAHDLDHQRNVVTPDPASHLDAHQQDHDDLDAATHHYLHAVGHGQPFFAGSVPSLGAPGGSEAPAAFVPYFIREPVPDSLLRPPRISFAS